ELAHYYGYYSAKVTYALHYDEPSEVLFRCDLGPKYSLESFVTNVDITADEINLHPGKPIDTKSIIDAEKALLWQLKKKGYATCQIAKTTCVATAEKHPLGVTFAVSPGPLTRFGPTQIIGAESVQAETIRKNIAWKEGDIYDPLEIEKTQTRLEKTAL